MQWRVHGGQVARVERFGEGVAAGVEAGEGVAHARRGVGIVGLVAWRLEQGTGIAIVARPVGKAR